MYLLHIQERQQSISWFKNKSGLYHSSLCKPVTPFSSQYNIINKIKQLQINPLLFSKKLELKGSNILITGKYGIGKTACLLNLFSKEWINKYSNISLTCIELRGYDIRGKSYEEMKDWINKLRQCSPVIFVLEELESLSRQKNKTQKYLLEFIMNNDISKTGIGIICISQSPERFIGQYPQDKWNTVLFKSNNCISFDIVLNIDDKIHLWKQFNKEYNIINNNDIKQLALYSNPLTASDIIGIIKETYLIAFRKLLYNQDITEDMFNLYRYGNTNTHMLNILMNITQKVYEKLKKERLHM